MTKRGQRHNATQHGVYSDELLHFGEKKEDFEALHRACVAELQPNGVLEEETVYAIASYMFRKRRVDQLFAEQSEWLKTAPEFDEIETALSVQSSIEEAKSVFVARQYLALLPDRFLEPIKEMFLQPGRSQDEQWVDDLKRHMDGQMAILEQYLSNLQETPRFKAESALRVQEALMKQAALQERLDWMIDKALKRLANLKVLKRFDLARSDSQQQISKPRFRI